MECGQQITHLIFQGLDQALVVISA
jgi:hypothetical protein